MSTAFLAAFSYWIMWSLDNITGTQALTRPIVLGTFTGLLCGDVTTGIVMGASLEAIYLGAVGVGGVVPNDWRTATTVSIAYVIGTGIDMETGLAIAVALGTVMTPFKQVINLCENALHPLFMRLAEKGEYKKFRIAMYLDLFIVKAGINAVVIFLFVLLGQGAIESFIGYVPKFIISGLGAAANLLVVVGLALIARSIWSKSTPVFLVLGFVLAQYLGLGMIPLAAIGFVMAYICYQYEMRFVNLETKAVVPAAANSEEDDFYD